MVCVCLFMSTILAFLGLYIIRIALTAPLTRDWLRYIESSESRIKTDIVEN